MFEFSVDKSAIVSTFSCATTMLGSLILCISRFRLDSNVAVGFVDDGRTRDTQNSIGLFSDILPLRISLGDFSVSEFLTCIRNGIEQSKSNSIPFLHLMDLLRTHRLPNPCETIFVDQSGLDGELVFGDCIVRGELDAKHVDLFRPKCDLLFEMRESQNGKIVCRITFDSSKYSAVMIERISCTISQFAAQFRDNMHALINSFSVISIEQIDTSSSVHRLANCSTLRRLEDEFTLVAKKFPKNFALDGSC